MAEASMITAEASRSPRTPPRLLLVDDDPLLRKLLHLSLTKEGYDVTTASNGHEAMQAVAQERPAVVLSDLRMPGMDGLDLLDNLVERAPGLPVVILTAHGTIPDAVRATQHGAVSFLTKPIDQDELRRVLKDAIAASAPISENDDWCSHIIARSPAMDELLAQTSRLAKTDAPLLIVGEPGTGKEQVARALYAASGLSGRFVTLACASLSEGRFASLLRGGASDAAGDAAGLGLLRAASDGALFLDELGELSLDDQGVLLGLFDDMATQKVRLISSTRFDLNERVEAGAFRADLVYRVRAAQLEVPTLAARREDIPLLVSHRLEQLAADTEVRHSFSPSAMELLAAAPWPGNVRQLFNVVDYAAALSTGPVVSARLVGNALGEDAADVPSYAEAQEAFTREYLIRLMRVAEGNVSKAARLAKRNRTDFYRLLSRHKIDWSRFKSRSATPAEEPRAIH